MQNHRGVNSRQAAERKPSNCRVGGEVTVPSTRPLVAARSNSTSAAAPLVGLGAVGGKWVPQSEPGRTHGRYRGGTASG